MKHVEKILSWLLPLVGLACVLFPAQITALLPFILGGVMVVTGLARQGLYLKKKEYLAQPKREHASDLILVIMGLIILLKQSDAIGLMGTVWGLIGLQNVTEDLDDVFRAVAQKQRYRLRLLEAAIKLLLALALLFDPFDKFATHIMLLGLEMIAVTFQRDKWPGKKKQRPSQDAPAAAE